MPEPWSHQRGGRPAVLFLCTHNAGRSQMALPGRLDVAAVRPIRDELERRVRQLLDQLDIPAG